jgi:hypothetical protein
MRIEGVASMMLANLDGRRLKEVTAPHSQVAAAEALAG